MPVSETLQNQGTSPNHLTPDPNVTIPAHVRDAAAAADAIHKQAYAPPEPEPAPPTPEELAARAAAPPPAETPPLVPEQQPPQSDFTAPADAQSLQDSEWARRYNSMRGRYEALLRTNGAMEEQMRQLGSELVRTQAMVQAPPAPAQQQPQSHNNLITDEDRSNYGDELLDLTRRAALAAVAPELQQLRADNQRLTQQVSTTSKRELFSALDVAIPNWRVINKSVQFKSWLALPNIYTQQARGKMLNEAVNGAQAPRVIALFKDFLAEANATGQTVPAAQIEQQAQAAPREPALNLETLAAPGRARPASGDSQVPVEKPIYTRAQISKFYDDKRRGFYAGRDAEVTAFEADLTAAQREGRIR